MSTVFGEIGWSDDIGGSDKKGGNNKDLWLRLEEGSNEMRLITQPFQYLVHKVKKDPTNPKDFGQKVNCSMVHGSCPVCATGDKAKARWFLGVISRKTGTYKILDISYQVFSQIRKLAKNTARWGDPTKYDIDIVVDKQGGAAGYYSVQPISKEPLSATDQQTKDDADLDYLKQKVSPPTADKVQRDLDRIFGVAGAVPAKVDAAPAASTKTASKATPVVSMTDDEDLNSSFPAYSDDTSAS